MHNSLCMLRKATRVYARRMCTIPPPPPPPAAAAIAQLYLRGTGRHRTGPGQPKVVAVVSGGGGHLFSWLLSQPGATSCLLEGRVPYDKTSLNAFLAEHGRNGDGVGFCSPQMAAELAAAARDRALMLTPQLELWPNCIGVACTATIVSHYSRRGTYRAHAATSSGPSTACQVFSHNLVKGARERSGEDAACALLALRALAEAAGLEDAAATLAPCGIRLEDTQAMNALGEEANGVEEIPSPYELTPQSAAMAEATNGIEGTAHVLVPNRTDPGASPSLVPLPLDGRLPVGTLVVPWDDAIGGGVEGATRAATEALSAMGLEGDGGDGAWSLPQAPVLLEAPHRDHAAAYLSMTNGESVVARALTNWAVLRPADAAEALSASTAVASPEASPRLHRALSGALPPGANVLLSPAAAHSMIASVLVDWESGEGGALIAAAAARGTKFVVARGRDASAADLEAAAKEAVTDDLPPSLRHAFVFVSDHWYAGTVAQLSDGSPSTDGVGGEYDGGWDDLHQRPHGLGLMQWSNGISFEGRWQHGRYEGWGIKAYSRGGGYAGMWKAGKRHGWGTSVRADLRRVKPVKPGGSGAPIGRLAVLVPASTAAHALTGSSSSFSLAFFPRCRLTTECSDVPSSFSAALDSLVTLSTTTENSATSGG